MNQRKYKYGNPQQYRYEQEREFERYRKQHEMREAARMLDTATKFLVVFIVVYLLVVMQSLR